MKRNSHITFLMAVLVALAGCNKDDRPFDIAPELTIISAEPTTLHEFEDSLIVVLEYTDGDGDLGFDDPDSAAVLVHDQRLSAPDEYFVKPLIPPGDGDISIQGTLRFRLRGTFIFSNANQEKTSFTIKMRDNAGHWSNEVTTPEITIVK